MASLYIQCFIDGYTLYYYLIISLYISIMVINITFSNLRANCHGNLGSISISPLINRAILSKPFHFSGSGLHCVKERYHTCPAWLGENVWFDNKCKSILKNRRIIIINARAWLLKTELDFILCLFMGAGENPQVSSEILIRDLSQVQCSEKLGYSDRTRTLVTPPTCLFEHVTLCHLQELCPNQWTSHLPNTVQTLL